MLPIIKRNKEKTKAWKEVEEKRKQDRNIKSRYISLKLTFDKRYVHRMTFK